MTYYRKALELQAFLDMAEDEGLLIRCHYTNFTFRDMNWFLLFSICLTRSDGRVQGVRFTVGAVLERQHKYIQSLLPPAPPINTQDTGSLTSAGMIRSNTVSLGDVEILSLLATSFPLCTLRKALDSNVDVFSSPEKVS